MLPTNKGNLNGAKAGEFNNLIRAAFDGRCKSPIMPRPKTDDEGNVVIDDDSDEKDVIHGSNEDGETNEGCPPRLIVMSPHHQVAIVTPLRQPLTEYPPSYFLSSERYLQLANCSIHGVIRMETDSVREKDKQHADKLVRVLRRRLLKHIRTKIADKLKHSHPALLFVRANLNRYTALLCYFGQARKNPIMHQNACLL